MRLPGQLASFAFVELGARHQARRARHLWVRSTERRRAPVMVMRQRRPIPMNFREGTQAT